MASISRILKILKSILEMEATLRFIINGGGRQIKPGSFKDFEKLLSGGGGWSK